MFVREKNWIFFITLNDLMIYYMNKLFSMLKNIHQNSFRTSGKMILCSISDFEHPEYFLTNISHSLLRISAVFIPNIQHSTFQTSVILCFENPVFSVTNTWTTILPNIRSFSFRSSGLFIPNIRTVSKKLEFGSNYSDRCP